VATPGAAVSSEFAQLASDEQIAKAAAALERNGIRSLLAATGADARGLVGSLLTGGAEVYNNTSQTLEATGVADDIERSGRYQPLRLRLYRMDREMQPREMRTLAASPRSSSTRGSASDHLHGASAASRVPGELLFDLLDRVERLPRVRALVIAVLDDQVAGGRAADVIGFLVRRRQGQPAVVRTCVDGHGSQPPGGYGQIRLARRLRSRPADG
jgi:hypothetical protein